MQWLSTHALGGLGQRTKSILRTKRSRAKLLREQEKEPFEPVSHEKLVVPAPERQPEDVANPVDLKHELTKSNGRVEHAEPNKPDDVVVSRIPMLPPELLDLIIQQLTPRHHRDVLKAMRLVNRMLCQEITPVLFETLHISVNELSLQRFANVATSPHLAQHVRELVLYKGCWDLVPDLYAANHLSRMYFRDLLQDGSWEVGSENVHDPNREEMFRLLENAPDEIRDKKLHARGRLVLSPFPAPDVLDTLNENLMVEMQPPLSGHWQDDLASFINTQNFPRLVKIHTPRWKDEDRSEYLIRRTGRVQTAWDDAGTNFASIMHITANIRLTTLDLHDLYIGSFRDFHPAKYRTIFHSHLQNLKTLSLGFRWPAKSVSHEWPFTMQVYYNSLTNFLEACALSLETLSVTVGPGSASSRARPLHRRIEQIATTRTVTATRYPRLRSLTLSNFAIPQSGLLEFLVHHSATLRALHLRDWIMPTTALPFTVTHQIFGSNGTSSSSSIGEKLRVSPENLVQALRLIPEHATELTDVSLRGSFAVTDEYGLDSPGVWRAQPSSSSLKEKTLLSRLESFMTRNFDDLKFPLYASSHTADILRLAGSDNRQLLTSLAHALDTRPNRADVRLGSWIWTVDALALSPSPSGDMHENVYEQDASWRFVDRRFESTPEQEGEGEGEGEGIRDEGEREDEEGPEEAWSSWAATSL